MTDRVQLLFGPYRAPRLQRGDRAFCLFRDTHVVITSWSDALISWPRCRALDGRRGGAGLLVDEELARAVRNESATAVKHWWGVSTTALFHWRKALGVTRTNNAGSQRLIRAAADLGADAMSARGLTRKEIEECRERAIRLNLGRHLQMGSHRYPLWTPVEVALLGTLPDKEVARRTGRKADAVRQKRAKLGLPNPSETWFWTADEVALLGTMTDAEVALRTARTVSAVCQKRYALGIPPHAGQ